MKIILTGITGALGREVARCLHARGHEILPIVRRRSPEYDEIMNECLIPAAIFSDLVEPLSVFPKGAGGIIHCAGCINFTDSSGANQKMMKNILSLAQKIQAPLYCVSTAFIHRTRPVPPVNEYEHDKLCSEKILRSGGVPFALFCPSIIAGRYHDGEISRFHGYYLLVRRFVDALQRAKIRFPKVQGKVDLVPVDWVAQEIVESCEKARRGMHFLTNSQPHKFHEVLAQTLEHFHLLDEMDFVDIPFEDFGNENLLPEEKELYGFSRHFYPYFSINEYFSQTRIRKRLDSGYITRILQYFEFARYERKIERAHTL